MCMFRKYLREEWRPSLSSNSGPRHLSPDSPTESQLRLSSTSNSPSALLQTGSNSVHISLSVSLVCLNPFSSPSGPKVRSQLLKLGRQAWSRGPTPQGHSSSHPPRPGNRPVASTHGILTVRPFPCCPFIWIVPSTPQPQLCWLNSTHS